MKLLSTTVLFMVLFTPKLYSYQYKIIDIGKIPSSIAGNAKALNDIGTVVGWDRYEITDPIYRRAFMWENGVTKEISHYTGGTSWALDINNDEKIVGTYYVPAVNQSFAYLWENNVMTTLPLLEGSISTEGKGINNIGEAVGNSKFTSGHYTAVKWNQNGEIINLGTFGNENSQAYNLNDSGVVVGSVNNGSHYKAAIWNNQDGQLIGDTGEYSVAFDINNSGQIVGGLYFLGPDTKDIEQNAFVYDNGTVIELRFDDGGQQGMALGNNDEGIVVGVAALYSNLDYDTIDEAIHNRLYTAFIWENGVMLDLNELIPQDSGWWLHLAADVSNNGEITGYGLVNEEIHSFLLIPVPEPTTLILFILGILGIIKRFRSQIS